MPEIIKQFEIIKLMDTFSFQANIIALNANLHIGRTQSPIREILAPIGEKYNDIVKLSTIKTCKIESLLKELSQMIFNDITERIRSNIKEIHLQVNQLIKQVKSLQKYLINNENSIDEFAVYIHEVKTLYNELHEEHSLNQIDNENFSINFEEVNATLYRIKKYIDSQAITLQKTNVLYFAGKLNLARNPNNEAKKEITSKLQKLASNAHRIQEICTHNITDSINLCNLLKAKRNNTQEDVKIINIDFEGYILNFHTRSELHRISFIKEDDNKLIINSIKKDIADFELMLHKSKKELDNLAMENNKNDYLNSISTLTQRISNNLFDVASIMCEKGGAILVLAHAYRDLTKRITKSN